MMTIEALKELGERLGTELKVPEGIVCVLILADPHPEGGAAIHVSANIDKDSIPVALQMAIHHITSGTPAIQERAVK